MPERHGVLERADFHFVIVSRVEQRDRSALVEPTFQFSRGEFRRRSLSWFDARNAKGDDLFLDANQHAVERLFVADADFGD